MSKTSKSIQDYISMKEMFFEKLLNLVLETDEQFQKDNYEAVEYFVRQRNSILKILAGLDRKIGTENNNSSPKIRNLALRIYEMDQRILERMGARKTSLARELNVMTHKKASVNCYLKQAPL